MSAYGNITDRTTQQHRTLCIKAGIIPGTLYAVYFCEYLEGTGATDWYTEDSTGNIKFNSKILKEHKKNWIKKRAGQKNEQETEDALASSMESDLITNAAAQDEKNAKTSQEKYDAAKNRIDVLNEQIRKLKQEKSDLDKSNKNINNAKTHNTIRLINEQIQKYEQDIKTVETSMVTYKQEIDNAKKEAEIKKLEAKKQAKGNKWWYNKLKDWKQQEMNETAKKNGTTPKKVLQEYSTEDIILLSVYANKQHDGANNTITWEQFDADNSLKSLLDNECKIIWAKFPNITSIRNDMDPKILAEADAITPDSSATFLTGAVSNTFLCAAMGKELLSDDKFIQKRVEFCANVTAAALAKLTGRVLAEITNSTAQIMDPTPIIAIPADAAQEMMRHILTPAEVMNLIADMLDDNSLNTKRDNLLQQQIDDTKRDINEKVQELNFLYGDKLNAFNTNVTQIVNTINQSPDWYIDNVNKIEQQYEKEMIKGIRDITGNVLDAKFQFRDNAVDVLSYNLVIPVNNALIKTQLEIIRALTQAIKRAEQIAISLAQKAIMQLLGLLGA